MRAGCRVNSFSTRHLNASVCHIAALAGDLSLEVSEKYRVGDHKIAYIKIDFWILVDNQYMD